MVLFGRRRHAQDRDLVALAAQDFEFESIESEALSDLGNGARFVNHQPRDCRRLLVRKAPVENAIEIANGIQYGLSTALYSRDVNRAFRAIRDLEAGITYINAPTIGAEVHLPFGGVKATGNGHREGGLGAIDFYSEWKAIYVDYSDRLQKAQIDRAD